VDKTLSNASGSLRVVRADSGRFLLGRQPPAWGRAPSPASRSVPRVLSLGVGRWATHRPITTVCSSRWPDSCWRNEAWVDRRPCWAVPHSSLQDGPRRHDAGVLAASMALTPLRAPRQGPVARSQPTRAPVPPRRSAGTVQADPAWRGADCGRGRDQGPGAVEDVEARVA